MIASSTCVIEFSNRMCRIQREKNHGVSWWSLLKPRVVHCISHDEHHHIRIHDRYPSYCRSISEAGIVFQWALSIYIKDTKEIF